MPEIEIQEVMFDKLMEFPSVAIYGKRRAGKTTWGKKILMKWHNICDRFVVFCGNDDCVAEWSHLVSPLYVRQFNEEEIKEILKYQASRASPYTDAKLPVPRKYRLCIVLDDCGSKKDIMKSQILLNLLADGRHYGILFLGLFQKPIQVLSENRDNFDYIGLMFTPNVKNVKLIFEEAITCCTYPKFVSIMAALTLRRGLCWIDNTVTPTLLSDYILYKEHLEENVKDFGFGPIGSSNVRRYANDHYSKPKAHNKSVIVKKNYEDDDDDESNDDKHDTISIVPTEIERDRIVFKDRGRGNCIIRKVKHKAKIE